LIRLDRVLFIASTNYCPISYSSTQERLHKYLNKFEICLNVAGYIPGFNFISGSARFLEGIIQIISNISLAIFNSIGSFLSIDSNSSKLKIFNSYVNIEYSFHGLANITRAFIELIPVVGGFSCIVYDHLFDHRYEYGKLFDPYEKMSEILKTV
jgi:hypothetical protein